MMETHLTHQAENSNCAHQAWLLAQIEAGLTEADLGEFATDTELQEILICYQ